MSGNWKIVNSIELEDYKDKILDMYKKSYEAIGLRDNGGWDGLKNKMKCSCYLLEDETKLLAVVMYKQTSYGNKISLVISASQEIGKTKVIQKLLELLKNPGFYIEMSDALEHILRKEGLDNIKDVNIIKKIIPEVTDADIFSEDDPRRNEHKLGRNNSPSGSYLRELTGLGIHRKALYGIPCLSQLFNEMGCERTCRKSHLSRVRSLTRSKSRSKTPFTMERSFSMRTGGKSYLKRSRRKRR